MSSRLAVSALSRQQARRSAASFGAIRWSSSTAPASSPAKGSGESKPPRSIDDSTSALQYKLHKRAPPPLPTFSHPRAPTVEEAVTNILYNTPPPSTEPYKKHTLNCLVQNEPGVLSRVSGILAARGFNIDSLVVCATEIRDLSRMCIVLRGQDGVIEQARRQLEDLVPVWAVLDYTNTSIISRELLLAKVSVLGPEYAEQQMTGGGGGAAAQEQQGNQSSYGGGGAEETTDADGKLFDREKALAQSFESSGSNYGNLPAFSGGPNAVRHALSASEALIAKNLHLQAVKTLAEQFGARIVDVAEGSVIIELSAKSSRVDAFLSLLRPFGVLEAARSGVMAMPRAPITRSPYDDEEVTAEAAVMDASLLPPG